jgi:chromate transporter
VNVFVLYLLLLRATLLSFSGLMSLPMIRNDLVLKRRVLTDRQLNTAVAAGRSGPGPIGLYLVSVGYFVAGTPGACAGWLAMVTPAFLIVPMLRFLGARAEQATVRRVIRAVTLAGAGLILSATLPLARDAVQGSLTLIVALASFAVLSFTRIDTVWVILASAALGLLGAAAGF